VPLTPTDVANKQFRIAFRGYSLDEVDAFLDEVETELSRLLRDNSDLKSRTAPAAALVPAPAPAPAAAPAPPDHEPLRGLEGQEAALRTLLLAQRTADEAIAEARAEAEQMREAARKEAESAVAAAQHEAQSVVTAARGEAAAALAASKSRAARLDAEVAAQISAATGNLDERRRSLEARIEELRAFEREYRTRLQAYLETQLRALGSRGGGENDGSAGAPVGTRPTAVGAPAAGAVGRPQAAAPVSAPDGPPREATPPGLQLQSVSRLPAAPSPRPVGPFRPESRGGPGVGQGEPPPA
jgi:DivIVA domain-containing protein